MSASIPSAQLQQALDTIRLFEQTPETSPGIVTPNLEIIKPWGRLRKIILYFFIHGYLSQLNPRKSAKEFKSRLSIIKSSALYDAPLAQTCAKACLTFNRLIIATNSEMSPSSQYPVNELLIDLREEERRPSPLEKPFVHRGALLKGPGHGMTRDDYDSLLGGRMLQLSPQTASTEEIEDKRQQFPGTGVVSARDDDQRMPHLSLIMKTPTAPSVAQLQPIHEITIGPQANTTLLDTLHKTPPEEGSGSVNSMEIFPNMLSIITATFVHEQPLPPTVIVNGQEHQSPPVSSETPEPIHQPGTSKEQSQQSALVELFPYIQSSSAPLPASSEHQRIESPQAPSLTERESVSPPREDRLPQPVAGPTMKSSARRKKDWRAALPPFQMTLRQKRGMEKK